MRRYLLVLFAPVMLVFTSGFAVAGSGGGAVRTAIVILDEDGNRSVNYRSFNDYEGFGLSLENWRYDFDSNLRLRADLRNLTLNNRNLRLGLVRQGRFGVDFANNQYRRVYGQEGSEYTRRRYTSGSFWFYPHQYVKLYGSLSRTSKAGRMVDLSRINPSEDVTVQTDYDQSLLRFGANMNCKGRSVQVEFTTTGFDYQADPTRDQSRSNFRLNFLIPIPGYEYVRVHGGFQRFETEFSESDYGVFSNTGWGGFTVGLPKGFTARYSFLFNRAGSDSDIVASDNLANAFYIGYSRPGAGGATIGYQQDLNDDFEDEVKGKSFYFSGWYRATPRLDFRGTAGSRVEDVTSGSRLIGNRDQTRHRISGKYRVPGLGSVALRYENRKRDNDQLGSRVEFNRGTADFVLNDDRFGSLSFGYTYSKGHYDNTGDMTSFEFRDHLIYGDIRSREYKKFAAGMGATYYRSRRDLDVESFSLRFEVEYRFRSEHRLAVTYNVHNFDDLTAVDSYYTANIVEISVIKDMSF